MTKNYIFLIPVVLLLSCGVKEQKMFTPLLHSETGIKFKNIIKDTKALNVLNYAYWYNGGGVAIGDINNDGLPDIYFTGNLVKSKLYLNKGSFKFKDITETAGVAAGGLWNTGTCMADVNGDGLLDIYVCRSAAKDPDKRRNVLFINNGDLTFTEKSREYGLDDPSYSTHAAFFDYDRDGDLDVYVLNHSLDEYAAFNDKLPERKKTPGKYFGDKLYRNDNGRFLDVSHFAGLIDNVLGFGLGLAIVDINNDNWPDIYVSNDYNEEDYLYINQRDGTFKESVREAMGHVSLSSMGNESGDFNNDLKPDIISLDMLPERHYELKMSRGPENYDKYNKLISYGFHFQTIRNMLQLNNGNGTFSEIGQLAGIGRTDWSWSPLLADYDNDGWKDLFISNGYGKDYLNMDVIKYVVDEKLAARHENRAMRPLEILKAIPDLLSANYMFHNNRDLTFTNVAEAWGFTGHTLSNGTAYADLDNDGDLDLVLNNINEYASVYRNNAETMTKNHFINIRLRGNGKNTFGIGAKVIIYTADGAQYMEMMPSRGYQSSVSPELHFGLGNVAFIDSLTICWPDSSVQKLTGIEADRMIVLEQKNARKSMKPQSKPGTIFLAADDNLSIDFRHEEPPFPDYKFDRLLPRGYSRQGPAMAKGDINSDGLEDLFIGGGPGQAAALFLQQPNGSFKRKNNRFFMADRASDDTDAVFFDADGDGDIDLFVTSGGYVLDKEALQDRLYLNDGQGNFAKATRALPRLNTSNSCVAPADIDGDGDTDLFVGGQLRPGNYPLAPPSYLLVNDGNGRFSMKTKDICPPLMAAGMISDAVFADVNNDKQPDLIVVGEWMKVRVFINNDGRLTEQHDNGLENTSGWWNAIAAADLDNDGDTDLIGGNMGINNPYKATAEHPVRLYYADFDHDGSVDPLMTYYIDTVNALAFSMDEFLFQFKSFKSKFPNYDAYAKLTAGDILTKLNLHGGDTLMATTFYTSVFLNDGNGRFKTLRLPVEAQFSPVYAIHTGDIDGDGHTDIILGGNQSNTRVTTGRFDALYGLLLTGKGDGTFETADPIKTGLSVMGDMRSIVRIENNHGKFMIFSLNNDTPKVYRLTTPEK